MVKSSKPPLAGLLAVISQLCNIEKQYYALSYLLPRRFLMKDTSLTTVYNQAITDLRKVEEWRSATSAREMASQLIQFVEARLGKDFGLMQGNHLFEYTCFRLELMKIYEDIANKGAALAANENYLVTGPQGGDTCDKPLNYTVMPIDDNFVPQIAFIVKKYKNCLVHESFSPLKDLFHWELDALQGLFQVNKHFFLTHCALFS